MLATSALIAGALAYQQWPRLRERFRKQPVASPTPSDEPSSIPPFSTKEPDRYQATRVITEIEIADDGHRSPASSEKFLVARDGQNRREEFDGGHGAVIVYLENAAGQFLLVPEKKIYTSLNAAPDENNDDSLEGALTNFSPERLLHETSATARYEKLGSESLAGRKVTKYRVTASEDGSAESTTLIWVDDELGMPLKSKTTSSSAIVTSELTDIRKEVDPQLFELPKDLKQVDFASLRAESALKPAASDQAPKSKLP